MGEKSRAARVPQPKPPAIFLRRSNIRGSSIASTHFTSNRLPKAAEPVRNPPVRRRFLRGNNFQRVQGSWQAVEGSRLGRCESASPRSLLETAFREWQRDPHLKPDNHPEPSVRRRIVLLRRPRAAV